jgi:hypothetical protein
LPTEARAAISRERRWTFPWSGELVSLDTTANTMTVKCRVAYQDAISELTHFRAGDRVWILWSGVHDYSDAVRTFRRPETGRKIDEDLLLPAELVSTEAPQSADHHSREGAEDRLVGNHCAQAGGMGHCHVPSSALDR